MAWRRLDGSNIVAPIKDVVKETIQKEMDSGHRIKVCIGTDSQEYQEKIEFATVIVFLREKKGGFMFIHNDESKIRMSLKEYQTEGIL